MFPQKLRCRLNHRTASENIMQIDTVHRVSYESHFYVSANMNFAGLELSRSKLIYNYDKFDLKHRAEREKCLLLFYTKSYIAK